ncbi:MAG: RsmD family RNA methyltransferase [Flavobacterium sp.]|jgi:16S rRNA (guanine966-N2)-methyltransferase
MRIISGNLKGKRLFAPAKLPVRPTTDMAKEALFNIINNQFSIENLVILDLFSGTGNIAYEFASRGARQITAVDADNGCVQFIKKTNHELDLNIQVLKSDVFSYINKTKATFDLIFADPPYDLPIREFEKINALVFEHNLLNPEGLLVIEHSSKMDFSTLQHFEVTRKYGGSSFSFFRILK